MQFSMKDVFNPAGWKAAGFGALGAFAGFFIGSIVIGMVFGDDGREVGADLVLNQALLFGLEGVAISEFILGYDNQASLRGRWDRDLLRGLAIFAPLAFISGGVGQMLYTSLGITRGIPWLLVGGVIGAGIGILRQDMVQAQRGAMGGAVGGLIGGLLVDAILSAIPTDAAFATASQIGMVITGGAIALGMRVAQEALKDAWLLGVSTGPYEGKEYPLNTARISVGRSDGNDISLFREFSMPEHLGAFVWQNDSWRWSGTPVSINGAFQADAALTPGDTIQLGSTQFRFQSRSFRTAVPVPNPYQPSQPYPSPVAYPAPSWSPQPVPFPAAPPPLAPQPAAPMPPPIQKSWQLEGVPRVRLPSAPATLQMGRAAGNDVVIDDGGVSSKHAQLDVLADSLRIMDLNSTNGTFVNNVRLSATVPVALHNGDRLKLGRIEYVVRQM